MSEEEVFQKIQPLLKEASDLHHLDMSAFYREELKEFSVIHYAKDVLFRVRARGKNDFVSFQAKQISLIDQWTDEMSDDLMTAIEEMVDNAGKKYDACAFIEECSDIGKCVREDDVLESLYCGYRKIMKSGRIYFGEKRNV